VEADDRDERVKRLVITERGEQVVYRLDVAHAKGIIDFTESLAPRDRKRLQAALGPVLGRQDPDEADTLAKAAA
jgi:DNA-binding MarR family transcriptional regulator